MAATIVKTYFRKLSETFDRIRFRSRAFRHAPLHRWSLPMPARIGTVYTTTKAGNLSDPTTFSPNGLPGNGDQIIDNHGITIDQNVTLGTSPPTIPLAALTIGNTGSGTTNLPTGVYACGYTNVDAGGGESSLWPITLSSGTLTNGVSLPRLTLPALPTGVSSRKIYLSNTGGAFSTVKLYATGVTGTTVDLISASWMDGTTTYAAATAYTNRAALFMGSANTTTVSAGVTLTLRGELQKGANSAKIALSAGSTLKFDTSAANSPTNTMYYVYSDASQRTGVTITASGTSGSHCTITSTATQAAGAFTDPTNGLLLLGTQFDLTYTDLSYLGNANVRALWAPGNSGLTYSQKAHNCTFDHCGNVQFSALKADTVLEFEDCTWTNSVGSFSLTSTGAFAATPTANRNIIGNNFDIITQFNGTVGCTIDKNIFKRSISSTGWASAADPASFNNNLFLDERSSPTAAAGPGPLSNSYICFYNNALDNPHFYTNALTNAFTYTISGMLFDAPFATLPTDLGDCILIGNPGTAQVLTVQGCIVLPIYSGTKATQSPGTMTSQLGGANATVNLFGNTWCGVGGSVGETYAGHTDQLRMKGNLAYGIAGTNNVGRDIAGAHVTDVMLSGSADYNGTYNLTSSYNGFVFSSGSPGAHDVAGGDPAFVDKTRNLIKWSITQGADGTIAGAIAAVAANPRTNIPAMISWVKEGFRPTNAAYKNASYPGDPRTVDSNGNAWIGGGPAIGAMSPTPPSSNNNGQGLLITDVG